MRNLDKIIKAYDVRGTVPDQLSPELVREIGIAFVTCLKITPGQGGPGAVVVGRDMRPSGPELVAAFAAGVQSQGCDVIDIGLCSISMTLKRWRTRCARRGGPKRAPHPFLMQSHLAPWR